MNIGTDDPCPTNASGNLGGLDMSYLPEITVCKKDATTGPPTNNGKNTTLLGQALIRGRFDQLGMAKRPILRGLLGSRPSALVP